MLTGVPRHHLDTIWLMVLPWLLEVERHSDARETVTDLRHWLDEGKLQLWVWLDGDDTVSGVLISEVIDQAKGRICRLRVCTGRDPRRWLASLAIIESWAREQGCKAMEPITRPGWGKLLASHGYKVTHVVLGKGL